MANSCKEIQLRAKLLYIQKELMLERIKSRKFRIDFVRKNVKKILPLSMEGWPRTKNMKDYDKWASIVFDSKIKGIYSLNTSPCDIIANLNQKAKELTSK